jgi:serine/threonine-protein kinase
MGEVHIAKGADGRVVAIKKVRKTLSLDPTLCERLTAEANILSRIDHPNVVQMLGGGFDAAGRPYLVMARAFGDQLDSTIAAGPVARERIANITAQLLEGLAAIHAAGVVHADLKTANVLVNELDRVTIVDFGLARLQNARPSDDEIIGGTPPYMAPELLGGAPPSVASDIYAAGVVIYELLTGTTPFPRTMPAVLLFARRPFETVQPPSRRAPERNIPAVLDAVLERALATTPSDRFTSVIELANALAVAIAAWAAPIDDTATRFWIRGSTAANVAPTVRRIAATDDIIQDALDSVSGMVGRTEARPAIAILEAALCRLVPADKSADIPPQAWRLESVLSALHATLGKREQATRLARLALQHAQRSNDPVAVARTAKLLERLAPVARLARGSRPPRAR